MRHITTVAELYSALQPILGLPDRCVSFELSMRADDMGVTVTCEHFAALDAAGIKQLECVLSEYELVRKPAPALDEINNAAEFHVVDFDAWMCDRTERAHAEYMARHADGGIDYRKGVTLGVDAAPASTAFIGRMNGAPMKEVRNGLETAESKSIYRQWLKGSGYRPCAHEYELDPWYRSGVVNCMYCRSLPADAAVSRKD